MSKILVTGATGVIGRKTIEHLLKIIPASDIIALARDTDKAKSLLTTGVEVRKGDYFDYESLLHAFKGVDKVMLTSTHAFTDRFTQHYNAITAARQMKVKHFVFMSIIRKEGSGLVLPEITESDIFTEQTLKASGMNYSILFHPPFSENLAFYFGFKPYEKGIRLPEGTGKMAPVTRNELAEAHAVILTQPGHENKTYTLSGSELISFRDIAKILAEIKNLPVSFTQITDNEYLNMRIAEGIPPQVAAFVLNWVQAINSGEYNYPAKDIEYLLGRKTTTFRQYLKRSPEMLPELANVIPD